MQSLPKYFPRACASCETHGLPVAKKSLRMKRFFELIAFLGPTKPRTINDVSSRLRVGSHRKRNNKPTEWVNASQILVECTTQHLIGQPYVSGEHFTFDFQTITCIEDVNSRHTIPYP